jgi:protein-arginine kinase activator protein McsA
MTTLEVLQRQLTIAIKEERYEDAARIRDEINKLDKSN